MGQLLRLAPTAIVPSFEEARVKVEDLIAQLLSPSAPATAGGLEALVGEQGREVLRLLMQGALDAKVAAESRQTVVVGPDDKERRHVRPRQRELRECARIRERGWV